MMAEADKQVQVQAGPNDTEARSELTAEEDLGIIEPKDLNSIEPIPPNGGYGWVCTLGVCLINAHTWGINSVSPSIPPIVVVEESTNVVS
jgi:hypothetical protein